MNYSSTSMVDTINILDNFLDNDKSNAECILIEDYNLAVIQYLESYLVSIQKHNSFYSFLNSEPNATYQFVDTNDIKLINETDSLKLFQKVRGKLKLIIYDSSKCFHVDFLKYCGWMRMYNLKT